MHTLEVASHRGLLGSGMDIPRSLETISTVIDAVDEGDLTLKRFGIRECDLFADDEVVADIRLGVPLRTVLDRGTIEIEAVRIGESDTLAVDVGSINDLLPRVCNDHETEIESVTIEAGRTVVLDMAITIDVEGSEGLGDPHPTDSATAQSIPFETHRDESVPAFDDVPYLEAIYEAYETFDEMRSVIELDVTTETVRRYMIDAGVHQPSSYQTTEASIHEAGDTSDEDSTGEDPNVEVLVADGIGIPDGITIEEFISAIRRSKTLHEVQQMMGLERDEAYEILEDLNLLDLVVGRLAMESERDVTREEIVDRLRRSAA